MTRRTVLLSFLFGFSVFAADPCPTGLEGWRQWQADGARALFASGFDGDEAALWESRWKACAATTAPEPSVQSCVAPLLQFAGQLARDEKPGHSLGASVSDADYFSKLPHPDELELPAELRTPEFFAWMDDDRNPKALEAALQFIEARNAKVADPKDHWLTFIYDSQHLPTPDNTGALGRFFVYVPGKDFDRFLQFGLRHKEGMRPVHGLSVVAIQKTDGTGKPLAKPVARFKDFWRVRNNGSVILSTRFIERGRLENCAQCHKTALLPITPDPATFDPKFEKTRLKVNALMAAYGDVKPFGIEPAHFGPGLGPEGEKREDSFLQQCSNGKVKPERYEVLREAMNCTQCHDGSTRGALNFPSARMKQPTSRLPLVTHYVQNYGKMPPGNDLTADERAALVACLQQEYYGPRPQGPGVLETWLRGDACWTPLLNP